MVKFYVKNEVKTKTDGVYTVNLGYDLLALTILLISQIEQSHK